MTSKQEIKEAAESDLEFFIRLGGIVPMLRITKWFYTLEITVKVDT